jgi:hypothetical protein
LAQNVPAPVVSILTAPPWPPRLRRLGLWILAATLLALPLIFSTQTQDQFELPKQLLLRAATSLLLGCLLALALAQGSLRWRRCIRSAPP